MSIKVRPYLRATRLRFFEYDPGLIRLRRSVRILLCAALTAIPALVVAVFLGPPFRGGSSPSADLGLVLPGLVASVLLAANISGDTARARQLGMLRSFLGAALLAVPASLVEEGSLAYNLLLPAGAFSALFVRRWGPSWTGTGILGLIVFVLVPRLGISPSGLPRFWLVLTLAFLSSFFVSFHVLPIRLTRALLDCLARFLAEAAFTVRQLRALAAGAPGAETVVSWKASREMRETLLLWFNIASRVLSPRDPAWGLLTQLAEAQSRLGKLLRIAQAALEQRSSLPGGAVPPEAGEALRELESVLESARRVLVIEGRIVMELAPFREKARRLQEAWEAESGPIGPADIQLGRFVIAVRQAAVVLGGLSAEAVRLAGREG